MKKDGGPAFPCSDADAFINRKLEEKYGPSIFGFVRVTRREATGMTLRQWYAGMAMQGLIASTANSDDWPALTLVAQKSFEMADAMLAFEEKEAGEKE